MRPRDVTTAPTPLVAVEASGSPAMRNRYIGRCTEVLDLLPGVASLATDALELPGDLARLGRAISALSDRLVREKEREAMLSTVSDRVLQGVLLHEVLDHIYESFRTLIPYDRIGCALLEDDGQVLRAQWARSEFVQSRLPQGYAARMEGSSLRSLVDIGTPRIIDDLEAYAAVRPRSHATRLILEEGVRSSLTCPLISHGHPVGFLFFSSRQKNSYSLEHSEVFQRLAGLLSGVVERSATYDRLAASNSALRLAQEALQQQATHDSLTGLLNRGAVVGALETMLTRAKRRQREGAVILLDIDHFKSVNDTHGHLAGDAVLREVGRRLARLTRAGDSVGRYGGEEFLVCLDECTREGAGHVADRLCASIRATPVVIGAVSIDLTVSAGVAQRRDLGTQTVESLVGDADAALYEAKRQGRDRVVESPECPE